MKTKEIGVVESVSVGLYATGKKLIDKIVEKQGLDKDLIKTLLRHNVITANQLGVILGKSASGIIQLTNPRRVRGEYVTNLDRCYPFPSSEEDRGFVFIHRNEKFDKLIEEFFKVSEE